MNFLNLDGIDDATPESIPSVSSADSPAVKTEDNSTQEGFATTGSQNFDFSSFLDAHFAGSTQQEKSSPGAFVGSLPSNPTMLGNDNGNIAAQLSSSYSSGPSNHGMPLSMPSENIRASLSRALQPNADSGGKDNSNSFSGTPSGTNNAVTPSGRSVGSVGNSPSGSATQQPVDRKRRDNINEKIQELMRLIPTDFFVDHREKSSGTKDGKPNKGQILSKAVEYINYVQQKIDENNRKEVELSIRLRNLEIANNLPVAERMNLLHTSAEIGLSQIGVGPLAEQPSERERKSKGASISSASSS
ncbi:DEKNAAC103355 [Brettanomyces naardenensis]|uniref:DEKNAAC103355 n=1 Tax=Brettanomyces naardenensis TaxID=13370 RepID=A0A448YMZ7_BRENA|nr:DEKNAAC103355 [Brettanomyces naardenensis]